MWRPLKAGTHILLAKKGERTGPKIGENQIIASENLLGKQEKVFFQGAGKTSSNATSPDFWLPFFFCAKKKQMLRKGNKTAEGQEQDRKVKSISPESTSTSSVAQNNFW